MEYIWQIATLLSVLIVWKMVNLRLSFFEVFNSNFNILNTVSQFSLKIDMHYQKTFFLIYFKLVFNLNF